MQTVATTANPTSLNDFAQSLPGRILIGFSATLVVAAAAHIAFPLPFTPVPLTLQPLAVLGVGLALGPVAGFLAMIAYLIEGALGMPVFAVPGVGGLAQLFGPTGGFLLAYPLVAAIAGSLSRSLGQRVSRFAAAAIACTAAVAVLFLFGATWLMTLAHLTVRATWIAAVLPFLPGEAVKVLAAAGIYAALSRTTRASELE